jgi:hypothetical protein
LKISKPAVIMKEDFSCQIPKIIFDSLVPVLVVTVARVDVLHLSWDFSFEVVAHPICFVPNVCCVSSFANYAACRDGVSAAVSMRFPSNDCLCNNFSNVEERFCEKMAGDDNKPILCHSNGNGTSVPAMGATTNRSRRRYPPEYPARRKHVFPELPQHQGAPERKSAAAEEC